MPADMTATAASNSATRRAEAATVLAGDPSGRLMAFRDFVANDARFSTNVDCYKVVAFHEAGEVLDARRLWVHRAGGDETLGLADFASRQQAWLARREGFEDFWQYGRRLLYGVVNAGGTGTGFGVWCLVADPGRPAPDALGVFPEDSAHRYTDSSGVVDSTRAVAEVTAWSDRAELAVIERASPAVAGADEEWPEILCRSDQYLEVTRAGAFPLSALDEVRLRAALRARLDELWAREETGEVLPDIEANEVAAYRVVDAWRRTHGVGVAEVL